MVESRSSAMRARSIVGVLFVLVSPTLALGAWHSANGPLETLAWFDAHRTPGDSIAYASAIYHASHARASHANRWRPTGYATLGLAGTLIGAALLLSIGYRRTAWRRQQGSHDEPPKS